MTTGHRPRAATTALLIRHAETPAIGRVLSGRAAGVPLTDAGRRQAARLPARLRPYQITTIYSSPLERALETAAPLASALALETRVSDAWTEMDFGAWTGLTFDELARDPAWQAYNARRCNAPVPGGETILRVQARVLAALDNLLDRHPGETVAVISHAEPIRSAVLFYNRVPLDAFEAVEILPASITALRFAGGDAAVRTIFDR